MISSLFSLFDPSSSPVTWFGVGNWVFILSPFWMMMWSIFSRPVGIFVLFGCGIKLAIKGFLQYVSKGLVSSVSVLLLGLFILVWGWNEIGLVPYSFSVTSHLAVNLSLAVLMFSTGVLSLLIIVGWKSIVAHMVPFGSPFVLSFALVLIETVSFLIRPVTLSLRLSGNIVTGHLLVALLCECGAVLLTSVGAGPLSSLVLVSLGSFLLFFETAVGLVQAVIFTLLVVMYWSE